MKLLIALLMSLSMGMAEIFSYVPSVPLKALPRTMRRFLIRTGQIAVRYLRDAPGLLEVAFKALLRMLHGFKVYLKYGSASLLVKALARLEVWLYKVDYLDTYYRYYVGLLRPKPIMGGATITSIRSPLFYKQQRGGLPYVGDLSKYTGNIFFVDSNTANGGTTAGFGQHPDEAITDLDSAVDLCAANQGDVIIVLPGHAESIVADSGVDIDVAGVTVVGLGVGDDRPTFTYTTAVAADFKLAAASVRVENCLFVAGIDALTGPIEISADDCQLINCEYRDDDTNDYETTDVVVTASTPLRMVIDGFVFHHDGGSGGTQLQSVIQLNGADHAIIRNCWLVADAGTGVIEDATTSDQILIYNCVVENSESSPTVAILLTATTSGSMRFVHCRVASGTTYITAGNDMQFFEC